MTSRAEERLRIRAQAASIMNLGCGICEAKPAAIYPIRRQVGMLVLSTHTVVQEPMCRDHGMETARYFLRRTLVQGWWELFGVFTNLRCIFVDARSLRRYRQLPEPTRAKIPPTARGAWATDPFRRYQKRWRAPDGWTDSVSTNGFLAHDPVGWR